MAGAAILPSLSGPSFLSEHSNHRGDAYGGSFVNRSRFLLETLAAVREVWPEHLPIEYDGRNEQTLAEAVELTRRFKNGGLDLLERQHRFHHC